MDVLRIEKLVCESLVNIPEFLNLVNHRLPRNEQPLGGYLCVSKVADGESDGHAPILTLRVGQLGRAHRMHYWGMSMRNAEWLSEHPEQNWHEGAIRVIDRDILSFACNSKRASQMVAIFLARKLELLTQEEAAIIMRESENELGLQLLS